MAAPPHPSRSMPCATLNKVPVTCDLSESAAYTGLWRCGRHARAPGHLVAPPRDARSPCHGANAPRHPFRSITQQSLNLRLKQAGAWPGRSDRTEVRGLISGAAQGTRTHVSATLRRKPIGDVAL